MTERFRWFLIVLVCAGALAGVIQAPQLLHMRDARYQGIAVELNSDEPVYLARVQEALSGRPSMAAEAFIGNPELQGTQSATLETWYGTLFSRTGLRAASVLQIMDSVMAFLLFAVLWMFLRLSGFTKKQALAGAALFSVIELYNLNRPVHLAGSTFLTLTALCGILLGLRFHWIFGVAGGLLMGTLVGVYVWSWMWVWGAWGILLALGLCDVESSVGKFAGLRSLRRLRSKEVQRIFGFGFVGLLAALPHLWDLWSVSQHPLYEQAVFRSGMHPGRAPESWIYSALFTAMFGSVLVAFLREPERMRRYRGVLVMITTAFLVIHQQVIHGIVFNYVSHELLLLVMSAVSVLFLAWAVRSRVLWIGAAAAIVYLAAVAYDGRFVLKQWHVIEDHFNEQHLAEALPELDVLPRSTILSSGQGSAFIAGYTHHDVVYSIYLKNVLLTHEEIAQRYCLTVLPVSPELRAIREADHLVYPDAVSAFHNDPSVREREVAMVEAACAASDDDPVSALRHFGVDYVFWDEKADPGWDLSRLQVALEPISQGEGWSLWKVPR